jgi:hypothetical protein
VSFLIKKRLKKGINFLKINKMTQHKMFSRDVTNSDDFLNMPPSTQALYFHLVINANNIGRVQPKSIIRLVQAKEEDLKILHANRFTTPLGRFVLVNTSWEEIRPFLY